MRIVIFFSVKTFSPVCVACSMLENELALHLDRVCNPQDVAQIIEMLVDAGCGYVQYNDILS